MSEILLQKQQYNDETVKKAKEELIKKFSNEYIKNMIQDEQCKRLYVHESRLEGAKNKHRHEIYEKEIFSARNLSNVFDIDVYLLPEGGIKQNGLILNKNPDGVTVGKILELKQSNMGSYSSLNRLIKEATGQFAEIVCINIANNDVILSEIDNSIRRTVLENKKRFKDIVILSTINNEPNYRCYRIKNNTLQIESVHIGGAYVNGLVSAGPSEL